MKSTHGGVLILVKLQASACNFTKINTPPWVFFTFLNCTNATKSRNAPHMGKLAAKPPPNLVNSDLTHSFLCELHFRMIYIIMWSEKTFENWGIDNIDVNRAKVQTIFHVLAPDIAVLNSSCTVWNSWKCARRMKLTSK